MKALTWILAICTLTFSTSYGQHRKKHHHAKAKTKIAPMPQAMPDWYTAHGNKERAHVYFPDYYMFYDANKQGFVYWSHNKWEFSPTTPLFLEKVDLSKSRIKILNGLSLDLQPQQNYPNYMKLYPPDRTGAPINVPVPNVMNNK